MAASPSHLRDTVSMVRRAKKNGKSNAGRAHRHEEAGLCSQETPSPKTSSPPPSHSPICTIGHGTRSLSELIQILQDANVTRLIDIRSFPRSRTNPQFNYDTLVESADLRDAGVEYSWAGDSLGGRRTSKEPHVERHTAIRVAAFRNYAGYMGTTSFSKGLIELMSLADAVSSSSGGCVAIMCSETLWWRCHRRMVADALVTAGRKVQHLGIGKEPVEHERWKIARVGEDGNLVYDV